MKKYWYLISGILFSTLIVIIIVVEHKGNYYKATPKEAHKMLLNNEIAVNATTISSLKEAVLFIRLSENVEDTTILLTNMKTINIKPGDLLKPETRKLYKNQFGTIILQSNDISLVANSWVLLTRMGYKNIKIWNEKSDEKIKYSFQPDSLAGLK